MNGVWEGAEGVNGGAHSTAVFSFSQQGNKLTGSLTAFNNTAPLSGTIVCTHLKFDVFGSNGYVAHFEGDVAPNGNQVSGGWSDTSAESGSWQATPTGHAAAAPRAQISAACKLPPTLKLAGHRHGRLLLDATVTAFSALTNSRLKLSLTPGDYLTHLSGAGASRSGGSIMVNKSLGTLGAGKHVFNISADVASLFAGAGQTVNGMNDVGGSRHWSDAAPAPARTGGDELVFSDSPEYLLGKPQHKTLKGKPQVIRPTQLASGRVAGNRVEGILYKQTDQNASGDFRVYLNHENRTPVPKFICVVIEQAIVPPAAPTPTQLTQEVTGEGEKPGDPVIAGSRALASYESHRRSPTPRTVVLDATNPAYTRCFGPIVDNGAAGVINAILDYHSSAPVRVGVVAINADRKGKFDKFESNPLGYHFADNNHPKGDPSRAYETDGPLQNPGETHVAGTFGYDEVTVNAMVDLGGAQPFGMLLAGNPTTSPGQYKAALDHGQRDNKGNYGVFYHVTVTVTGSSSESAEIVFNPRAVGKSDGVTNAFAGIADVPSGVGTGTIGRAIAIPSSGAIKNSQEGTVLGSVHGGQSFSFDFMPPGGASSPDAIVVLPQFIRVKGTLGFPGGSAAGTPNPLIVRLR